MTSYAVLGCSTLYVARRVNDVTAGSMTSSQYWTAQRSMSLGALRGPALHRHCEVGVVRRFTGTGALRGPALHRDRLLARSGTFTGTDSLRGPALHRHSLRGPTLHRHCVVLHVAPPTLRLVHKEPIFHLFITTTLVFDKKTLLTSIFTYNYTFSLYFLT